MASFTFPFVSKALSAASEARHLEELNDAMVPKLYAQLYELRRAGDAWWRWWWMELGVGGYGKMWKNRDIDIEDLRS